MQIGEPTLACVAGFSEPRPLGSANGEAARSETPLPDGRGSEERSNLGVNHSSPQSLPSGWPSLGHRARQNVVGDMFGSIDLIDASARAALMPPALNEWPKTASSGRHFSSFGATWKIASIDVAIGRPVWAPAPKKRPRP